MREFFSILILTKSQTYVKADDDVQGRSRCGIIEMWLMDPRKKLGWKSDGNVMKYMLELLL